LKAHRRGRFRAHQRAHLLHKSLTIAASLCDAARHAPPDPVSPHHTDAGSDVLAPRPQRRSGLLTPLIGFAAPVPDLEEKICMASY